MATGKNKFQGKFFKGQTKLGNSKFLTEVRDTGFGDEFC